MPSAYRLGKTSLGNNIPAKPGCGPRWTNGRKHENEVGTFLDKAFIYNQVRKGVWLIEWGLFLGTAGRARNLWGATKGNLQKRHIAELS